MMLKRLLFMGTPEFSVPSLSALHRSFPELEITVITKPDKVRGRGKTITPCPVKAYALSQGLAVHSPRNKEELTEVVEAISPDLIVIIAYGMILPKVITDGFLCMNIHASILPKYRGPSPIHAALLNGDSKTGVTLMCINEKMDAGDSLVIEELAIQEDDNFGSLHDKLSELGAKTLSDFLASHSLDDLPRKQQDHSQATYCKLIQKDDTLIDWQLSSQEMMNRIRAFSPSPGATLIHDAQRVKILEARLEDGHIRFLTVKPEGKSAMSYADYCLGHPKGLYHAE